MKIAFLDRDGLINEDYSYVFDPVDFHLRPGIFDFLHFLRAVGFSLAIVTNQSGIGRGYFTLGQYLKLNDYMIELFLKSGLSISYIEYCPHSPDIICDCRKPKPGMIQKIIDRSGADVEKCVMIGDKYTDMLAAKRAGIKCRFKVSTKSQDKYGKAFEKQLCELRDLLARAVR